MMKRFIFRCIPVALLALLLPLIHPQVATAVPPQVWIQNAADRAFSTTTSPPGAPTAVELHSAKNEYEAAQVLIRSSAEQDAVSLEPGPLTTAGGAQLPAAGITVSRVANHTDVQVMPGDSELPTGGVPGHYPDALVENTPVKVPENTTQPYWYSVYVPANQPAGVYRGHVTVRSSLGDVTVAVSVTVYEVTIPPTNRSTFKMNNWFGSAGWDYAGVERSITDQYGVQKFDANWWKVMENFAKNHAKHRNNVIYADFQALLIPNTTIAADGTYNFGWQTFDRFIELFIKHGAMQYIATPALLESPPGKETGALPRLVKVLKSDGTGGVQKVAVPVGTEASSYLHTAFRALKQHLDQKGWSEIFYMSANDEPKNRTQLDQTKWLLDIYKQHFTGSSYKTLEAHNGAIGGADLTALENSLTSFTPETGLYDGAVATYQDQRIKGKELWLYTAWLPHGRYMNRFMSYHLNKTRLLPWLVWKVGGVGYLHWGWNYWCRPDATCDLDAFTYNGDAAGDRWLVRPNKAAYDVYDSIRSEAQLDGLEDYELLVQLEATKPVAARTIANTLITNLTEYTRSGAEVADRHREMLQLLSSSQPDFRLPYSDDFASGVDRNWVHTVGSWSVRDGVYVQSDSSHWNTVSAVRARAYSDVVMTFDAKIDAVNTNGGNANWIGAVVRSMNATDIDSGYLVGVRNTGSVFLYRSGRELATATVPGYTPNASTRVKVVARGNRITVFVNDHPVPLIDRTDAAFRTGYAALVTGGVAGRFDNLVLNPEVNPAEARPVEATSAITDWGWSPGALTDGRTSSTTRSAGYSSEIVPQESTQSVTVDLGRNQPISRVDLWPRNDGANTGSGFPENFTVQTSSDKVNWVPRVTRTGYPKPTAGPQAFVFPTVAARYVKVEGTKHRPDGPDTDTHRMQFAELQVSGGNLAAGRPVTVSSSYEADGWSAGHVTDGTTTSLSRYAVGWSSNAETTVQHAEDLVVDLGAPATVSRVDLTPRTDSQLGAFFPRSFVIETSPDAVTWSVRRTVTDQPEPMVPDPVSYALPVTADVRFVRIRSDQGLRPRGSEYRMQFAELEVYAP